LRQQAGFLHVDDSLVHIARLETAAWQSRRGSPSLYHSVMRAISRRAKPHRESQVDRSFNDGFPISRATARFRDDATLAPFATGAARRDSARITRRAILSHLIIHSSHTMSQRHNRRQRKKLHIAEFQELAFNATAQYRNELSDLERGQLIDAFIDFVEANGLLTVASADEGIGAYVISGAPRGTTTDTDRENVRAWLAARPELTDVRVSEFTDAWYPDA